VNTQSPPLLLAAGSGATGASRALELACHAADPIVGDVGGTACGDRLSELVLGGGKFLARGESSRDCGGEGFLLGTLVGWHAGRQAGFGSGYRMLTRGACLPETQATVRAVRLWVRVASGVAFACGQRADRAVRLGDRVIVAVIKPCDQVAEG